MNGVFIFMGSNSRSIYPIHNGSYGSLAVGIRIRILTKSTFKFKYPSNKPWKHRKLGGVGFGIPLPSRILKIAYQIHEKNQRWTAESLTKQGGPPSRSL